MLDALVAGKLDAAAIAQLKHCNVRASTAELTDALDGRLSETHRLVLGQHLEHIDLLVRQRCELEQRLKAETAAHCEVIQRLCEVPGINLIAAYTILAEIGPGTAAFRSARQLASWAGLCPGRNESAEVIKSTRCAKGNRFVRSLLTGDRARRLAKGSYWEESFARMSRRIGVNKALWAVAHRLLRLIWNSCSPKCSTGNMDPEHPTRSGPNAGSATCSASFEPWATMSH
jgi:transposase